jgi:hypothetical protein
MRTCVVSSGAICVVVGLVGACQKSESKMKFEEPIFRVGAKTR